MSKSNFVFVPMLASALSLAHAQTPVSPAQPVPSDPALAKRLGADERGMRKYILVILKTGPRRMADGPERDEIFRNHFANIERLAKEKKLAIAGPFGESADWRGMFILAVESVKEAEGLVATDPIIGSGEMTAEYHQLYASAALMSVSDIHAQIVSK